MRYGLLLKALHKHTPDDHEDKKHLTEAIAKASSNVCVTKSADLVFDFRVASSWLEDLRLIPTQHMLSFDHKCIPVYYSFRFIKKCWTSRTSINDQQNVFTYQTYEYSIEIIYFRLVFIVPSTFH